MIFETPVLRFRIGTARVWGIDHFFVRQKINKVFFYSLEGVLQQGRAFQILFGETEKFYRKYYVFTEL